MDWYTTMHFVTLYSSKIEVSGTLFFDIVTTHNDHPSYVKLVSGSIHVFFTYLGIGCVGRGLSMNFVHNLRVSYWYWVCVSLGCALLGVNSLRGGLA